MYAIIYRKTAQKAMLRLPSEIRAEFQHEEYERLSTLAEAMDDMQAFDEAKAAVAAGEELVPASVVDRLAAGEPPLRVWREHRGLTLAQVARQLGIDETRLARFEAREESLPAGWQARMAAALRVDFDDLDF